MAERFILSLAVTCCVVLAAQTESNAFFLEKNPNAVKTRGLCDPVDYTYAHIICAGETYQFGSELLTTSGEYQRIELKQDGCDSVINLFLGVIPRSSPVIFELVAGSPQSVSANGAQTCVSSGPLTFAASVFGGTWVGDNVDETGTYQPTQVGIFQIGYQYTNDNGCVQIDYLGIEVISVVPVDAGGDFSTTYDSGPIQLNAVQPSGGTWSGPGVTDGIFDPQAAGIGTFSLYYSTPDCGGTDGIEATVEKGSQTIYFDELSERKFGEIPFDLGASTNSGLGVLYNSSDHTVATVTLGRITIVGVGSTIITASQPGNEFYHSAAERTSTLIVTKGDQQITFGEIPAKLATDESFTLSATSNAQLPIHYSSSDPSIVAIEGNTAIILASGTVTITAMQSGTDQYNAAEDATRDVSINKADQSINFSTIEAHTLGDVPFTPQATATSGDNVIFSSSSDKVSITNNEVTLVKSGRTILKADQPGSSVYNSAATVEQSFCINPPKPSITGTTAGLTSSAAEGNQWFKDGSALVGETLAVFIPEETGNYQVQVTTDDCLSELSDNIILVIAGETAGLNSNIALYPNPTHDRIEIQGIHDDVIHSEVMNLTGRFTELKLIKRESSYLGEVNELASGHFVLRVITAKKVHYIRFVKE